LRKTSTGGAPEESKLYVIWKALQFRNENRDLFHNSEYIPIAPTSEHVCAFAREWKDRRVIVVAPRLIYTLCDGQLISPLGAVWKDTKLQIEIRGLRNVFTGEMVESDCLAEILKTFPIALLAPR
jgi:maltooligosyltrehalose synthase